MLQGERFVFKFVAVDGLAASAVTSSKVTTLNCRQEIVVYEPLGGLRMVN